MNFHACSVLPTGADTGLNLTGAITENGHRALGTSRGGSRNLSWGGGGAWGLNLQGGGKIS